VEGGEPEKTGNFSSIRELIDSMEKEHDSAGGNMKRIEELSSDFTLPEGACASYQVAYQKLREFRDDLERHVHLENNILFPQAEQLEEELKEANGTGSNVEAENAS
jgi:regulator of cell morphogenesis and NO signaling